MNKLVALLRVKDAILFIDQWLTRMNDLVDEIVVVDNGSTDGTLEILQCHSKVVDIAQTEGFDEGRDKLLVYELARKRNPDWCIWLDADEIFENNITRKDLVSMMNNKVGVNRYRFRRFHFHVDDKHFEARLDKLLEQSAPSRTLWRETKAGYFKNLKIHNGDIQGISGSVKRSKFRLKHLGSVNKQYLERKTRLYQQVDEDQDRKQIYEKHLNQNLPTWKWYEFDENPIKANLQVLFFDLIFPVARIYYFLKRKFRKT